MFDFIQPKNPLHPSKKLHNQIHSKIRVNIGDAFERWRQIRATKDFKKEAKLANFR